MMNIFRMNVILAAVMVVILAGCATEDPLTPSTTKPPAPTGNMVQSVSETSVRLKWSTPSSTVDVTGYVMMAIEVTMPSCTSAMNAAAMSMPSTKL